MLKWFSFLSVLLVFSTYANSQSSITKINPTLYQITGLGGNVTAKITDKGIVVFDAGATYNAGLEIQRLIKQVSDKPVSHIVLTHYHYDHSYGLASFPADVTLIGHADISKALEMQDANVKKDIEENIPQRIEALNAEKKALKASDNKRRLEIDSTVKAETSGLEELKKLKLVLPGKVYETEMTLVLGRDTLVLNHTGNGHTSSDTWVLLKNDNVVVLGDLLFTNSMPYIDDKMGASTENWIKTLNALADKNYSAYISGHGELATAADLKRFAGYLTDLRKEIGDEIHQGKSLDEIKKSVKLAAYSDFGFQFFRDQNIEAVYNELSRK